MNQNEATNHCEFYDITKNTWMELPKLPSNTCSSSVITSGKQDNGSESKYLFSFGGINKMDGQLNIISMIYRLELEKKECWEELPVSLAQPLCDIGLTKLTPNKILIFGGWNYESKDTVLQLTNYDEIERTVIEKVKRHGLEEFV